MNPAATDTIVAVATARGNGAIGVVRLSGPKAFAIAERISGNLPPPRTAGLRRFVDPDSSLIDQGLVIRFVAPNSFTGEDLVELQAHGGAVVLDMLQQAATRHGARLARPGEFSERAFLNDRIDLVQAEAIADLIQAGSQAAVRAANRSLQGEFSAQVEDIARQLMALRTWVEGALDFSDEDVDWLGDQGLIQRYEAACKALEALRAKATQGRRLQEGMVVVIAGAPNVGKSSLLNRLSRTDAAIVTPMPGTTRDPLREQVLIGEHGFTLIDTAGLRQTQDPIEAEGIARARKMAQQAELILYLLDDRKGLSAEDQAHLRQLNPQAQVLLVYNKIDLSGASAHTGEMNAWRIVRISAHTGEGMQLLQQLLLGYAATQDESSASFSARRRHLDALARCATHLQTAFAQLHHGQQAELSAEELRLAQAALGEITGKTDSEDLLGEIFSRFCIGK